MAEECLICKAPLKYFPNDIEMECMICHKKEYSKTQCEKGHYVCNSCHTRGVDSIFEICFEEKSTNPIDILQRMMQLPFCHMHGPEHHVMVGAALLTAYKNAGGNLDLPIALSEMYSRGSKVPGGACGFLGACGAGISAGMYISIVTNSTPLATKAWGLANQMSASALNSIGKIGGPRCCKRDSFLAIREAIKFTKDNLGVEMSMDKVKCNYSSKNNQCLKVKCPFYRE